MESKKENGNQFPLKVNDEKKLKMKPLLIFNSCIKREFQEKKP